MNIFENKVELYFNQNFDKFCDHSVFEQHQDNLDYGDENLGELMGISAERHKYRLDWAFEEAERRFNEQNNYVKQQMEVRIPSYNQKITAIREEVHDHIRSTSRNYNILSNTVEVIDIVVSVLLILGITLLSTHFESEIESFLFLTIFILVIALIKVLIDRKFVIPTINEWGWRRYDSITEEVINIAAITMAMRLAILNKVERNEELDQILEICDKGLTIIKSKKGTVLETKLQIV